MLWCCGRSKPQPPPPDLVSADAAHLLLHDGVGLQHGDENLHRGVQRAVVGRHGDEAEDHLRPAGVQEAVGGAAGAERPRAWRTREEP